MYLKNIVELTYENGVNKAVLINQYSRLLDHGKPQFITEDLIKMRKCLLHYLIYLGPKYKTAADELT